MGDGGGVDQGGGRAEGTPPSQPARSAASLSPKQRRFVLEYLKDLNGTQAAIRAKYSPKTAESQASRLLSNAKVKAFVRERILALEEKSVLAVEDLERELHRLIFFDPRNLVDEQGRMRSLKDLDEDTSRALASVDVEALFEGRGEEREQIGWLHKVRFWDKRAAIELAMKRRGLLKEQVEHTGAGGAPLSIVFKPGGGQ